MFATYFLICSISILTPGGPIGHEITSCPVTYGDAETLEGCETDQECEDASDDLCATLAGDTLPDHALVVSWIQDWEPRYRLNPECEDLESRDYFRRGER